MLRCGFFIISLIISCLVDCQPPELTPKETNEKINEILQSHFRYQKLNPDLIPRILQNFLEDLDPYKCYFLENEIHEWLKPSGATISRLFSAMQDANYEEFNKIHLLMKYSVDRRAQLEKEIASQPTPKKLPVDFDWKKIPWATSNNELKTRLLTIKGYQLAFYEKVIDIQKDTIFSRLDKKRVHQEKDIIGSSEVERQKILLSYVIKAVCSALDAHTYYFTPFEASQFVVQVQQRLFGIGVQLQDTLNGFAIEKIVEGTPASEPNKLKVKDVIIAVNKQPVTDLVYHEVIEKIRGEKGTPVLISILRKQKDKESFTIQKLDIELKRGEIVIAEGRLETSFEPHADGIIPCIRLLSFYQDPTSSSTEDVKKAIEKLRKDYLIKGVILDLRNNAGGLLPQAVGVAGLFLTKGIVVSVKDNANYIQHFRNSEDKMIFDGPLVVLTNKASASAAEIVAQTLQDYGRAIVVGDKKTFGKGTFQSFTLDATHMKKVNPKGEYKVTRGMYYTVSGKSPQLVGVLPDILVPGPFSEIDFGEEFSKYPLPPDVISAHFIDDLNDIPPVHRNRIRLLYNQNLQNKITIYTKYLDLLKKNSELRIKENKNYQKFLADIKKKPSDPENADAEPIEKPEQTDFQQMEAFHIMKDLIFLEEIHEKYAASY
ncbi:MAG: S41 family peptidase [Chlamydiota bacterium]